MADFAEIRFGEWLPDAPDYKNPGCTVAQNVYPVSGGYAPYPDLESTSEALTSTVKGAAQLYDTSGNSIIVGGTDDRLFIRRSSITETTGLSSLGAGEAWDFARFNDFVVATGSGNSPQALTNIDSDTSWSNLGGSPPTAKRCARVGDFLMLGNLATDPAGIAWSSFNSPATSWSADRGTQAGSATPHPEFGAVQKIIGGRFALLFQERGISRLSYVGPPVVWRSDIIAEDKGTVAPHSVVNIGYQTFFLDKDGFWQTNGSAFSPLGSTRVNKWFFDNVEQTAINETHASVDWQRECIVWAFKSNTGMGDVFDCQLVYSWAQQKFTALKVNVGWMVGTSVDGVDLDSLDAVYGDLDSIPVSLDSVLFRGGDRRLAAFVTGAGTSEYKTFTGEPLRAEFITGEFQPKPGHHVFCSEIRPVCEANEWGMQGAFLWRDTRGAQSGNPLTGTSSHGFIPVRADGAKMAARLVFPAGTDWQTAQGVQVPYRVGGTR